MVDRYYALTMLTVVRLPLSTLYSWDIPVRIMGGRHSYGGYCSHAGVVLDSAGSEFVVIGGLCPAIGVVRLYSWRRLQFRLFTFVRLSSGQCSENDAQDASDQPDKSTYWSNLVF